MLTTKNKERRNNVAKDKVFVANIIVTEMTTQAFGMF